MSFNAYDIGRAMGTLTQFNHAKFEPLLNINATVHKEKLSTIMGKSLGTNVHFWRFCTHARHEYNFACLTSPPPPYVNRGNYGCVSLRKSKIGFFNPKESENGFCVSLLNRLI